MWPLGIVRHQSQAPQKCVPALTLDLAIDPTPQGLGRHADPAAEAASVLTAKGLRNICHDDQQTGAQRQLRQAGEPAQALLQFGSACLRQEAILDLAWLLLQGRDFGSGKPAKKGIQN